MGRYKELVLIFLLLNSGCHSNPTWDKLDYTISTKEQFQIPKGN